MSYAEIERLAEEFFATDHQPMTATDLATALEAHAAEYDADVAAGKDRWLACVRIHQKYWFDECLAQAAEIVEAEELRRRAA